MVKWYTFAKVIAQMKVACFLLRHDVYIYLHNLTIQAIPCTFNCEQHCQFLVIKVTSGMLTVATSAWQIQMTTLHYTKLAKSSGDHALINFMLQG